ncbi:hypothetical protein Metfor_2880 [Methanoregula formicica SMSP]|uniref:Uncharacterized protein n=2 Tax=Methanoregula formicica TaxID=882104 RepID=L0HIK3_METFS|nr:hypothetical protein Metfor_2880 [Methanoregula formicica SMSP]
MRGYWSFHVNKGVIRYLLAYFSALVTFVAVMITTEEFPYALVSSAAVYIAVRVVIYLRFGPEQSE